MKVILVMAMSLNGIISLDDGTEDFLSHAGGQLVWGLAASKGALIWGRRTDEIFQSQYAKNNEKIIKNIPKVVVSTNPNYRTALGYELATSPQAAIAILEAKGVKEAVVMGGSKLNRSFLGSRLVDEVMVNLEPVLIGKGLPLFAIGELEIRLKLLTCEQSSDGEILARYQVLK